MIRYKHACIRETTRQFSLAKGRCNLLLEPHKLLNKNENDTRFYFQMLLRDKEDKIESVLVL